MLPSTQSGYPCLCQDRAHSELKRRLRGTNSTSPLAIALVALILSVALLVGCLIDDLGGMTLGKEGAA